VGVKEIATEVECWHCLGKEEICSTWFHLYFIIIVKVKVTISNFGLKIF
jgi:hypothetical protein